MKKIKIMLAGFVNHPNAQNINCYNIAKRLDKNKFEVHALYCSHSPIDKREFKKLGIKLHYVNLHKIAYDLTLAWAFRKKFDILYLPKLDQIFANYAMKKHDERLLVSSIEMVITKDTLETYPYKKYAQGVMYDMFSISQCIKDSAKELLGIETDVIPLGVNKIDNLGDKSRSSVKNVVWVSSMIDRKKPMRLLECAKAFPTLNFTMIGDGDLMREIKAYIENQKLSNVKITGRIPNAEVYEYMNDADLLLMTSDLEGLPKAIQEAAQCGVPSIYIANLYTVDFIDDGKNGYAVYSVEEMIAKIKYLIENPIEYRETSQNVKNSIKNYTWDKLISEYENWFIKTLDRYNQEKLGK